MYYIEWSGSGLFSAASVDCVIYSKYFIISAVVGTIAII